MRQKNQCEMNAGKNSPKTKVTEGRAEWFAPVVERHVKWWNQDAPSVPSILRDDHLIGEALEPAPQVPVI